MRSTIFMTAICLAFGACIPENSSTNAAVNESSFAKSKVLEVTDANFEQLINSNPNKPVLVDFWAEWCGPCKAIGPVIEELATDFNGRAIVGKLDVDSSPEISGRYGIRSIPTILILKNGQVVDKNIGATTKSVLTAKLQAQLSATP